MLGIGDDVSPEPGFASVPQVTAGEDSFLFQVQLRMENKDIMALILKKAAHYVCEASCPATLYRRCFFSRSPDFRIEIPANQLAGEVRFQFFVTTTEKIIYTNRNFHPDYAGARFQLEPGDIIAWLGEFTYDVEIQYNRLRSVGSFMEICRGDISQPQFEYDGDRIMIRLPEALYEQYREKIVGNTDFANIIHSSLVLNALISALMNYRDYDDKLWARTLHYRVNTEKGLERWRDALAGGNFNDISELAHELLLDPYSRMFASLDALAEAEEG